MSKARRDWYVDPLKGSLVLSMAVDVNGKTLKASCVTSSRYDLGGPPPEYVERQLRSMLMRTIEDELLGPLA